MPMKAKPGSVPGSRRRFLGGSAAVTGAALASSSLTLALPRRASAAGTANLPPNVPQWMKVEGKPFVNPPYGQPSPYEKEVVRRLPSPPPTFPLASFTPLQDLHGVITPNGLVFERHHNGVPDIDPGAHRLMVHGLVNRPLVFTMDDLLRFPSVSRTHFLECSGNTFMEWKTPTAKTLQFTHGLLSCCEWTGVPLSVVLDEAGVQPEGRWVLAEGADSAAMTRSIPIDKCLDDALLVYAQNGEMLRPEQGYPLRLFLPGFEGNMSVKWLRRLKVGTRPFHTREETSKYTDLLADGSARQFTFYMEAKSVVCRPSGGMRLGAKGFHEISGLAWSGRGRVRRVDVSVDGGSHWREAKLEEPVLSRALTRFRLPWHWDGAPAVIQSRAIDESGYVQPTRAQLAQVRGTNGFYHFNAIQSWQVETSGEVRNVHA